MNNIDKKFFSIELHDNVIKNIQKKKSKNINIQDLIWIQNNKKQWLKIEKKIIYRNINFEFEPLVVSYIKEKKHRKLYKPKLTDKIILMKTAKILTESFNYMFSDSLYSYRPGLGQHSAISAFKKYLTEKINSDCIYIFKTDIKKYGESINKGILLDKIRKNTNISNNNLLYNLLVKSIYQKIDSEIVSQTGIPTGSPIVPFCQNYYLHDLDKQLGLYDIFYARFGDDILIASTDQAITLDAVKLLKAEISNLGLQLSENKSEFINFSLKTNNFIKDSDFKYKANLLWLGHIISKDASISAKREFIIEFNHFFKRELNRVLIEAKQNYSTIAEREMIYNNFINNIFKHPKSIKYIHKLSSPLLVKFRNFFEAELAKYITRKISMRWGISKKHAWKIYKRSRKRSYNKSKQVGSCHIAQAA